MAQGVSRSGIRSLRRRQKWQGKRSPSIENRLSSQFNIMKLDFDSDNDNNEFGAMLEPLDLDFNKDIEEMSLPDEYNPDLGDEEDDD